MAALLNPTARRLTLAACRRLSTPPAVEPLVAHRSTQARCNSSLVEVNGGFGEMVAGTQRYYVLGGKGGVGTTSMAASLAMKFANRGEPTLIVSMHPAHSLGDTFEQDLSGGNIVPVNGVDSLFAAEIGHVNTKEESSNGGSFIRNILDKIGLGVLADPLGKNKLHEMLMKTPGLGEAVAISKLVQIVELQESNKFRRIVLDTPATGHTLNLLSATTLMEKLLGMANKAVNMASSFPALKSAFGKDQIDIEVLRKQIARVHELMQDPQSTEFIIVTIPTVMAITESSRFHASLKKDGAPATRLIVNQVLPPSTSDCRFCSTKRKEEARALNMISNDRELGGLELIQAPLVDVEVRGAPALRFFSDVVWK
ncbi:ATPase GET3B-like isoform X2 [Hordeum vulgare subsp. vulgare]|uniref:ATPase GET3B-like isoform X2 n=1 Tax=Hordeum vulgare subsp. vulgare TaxID=112509 RepID=UPI001D1A47BF|nr:ATPase GET3B-like isoform X2 [Hordeum vulgare subsp. vulgare]